MKLVKLLTVLILITFLAFVHSRGFTHYDEGWFLYAGERFFNGEIPYKDFQYLYNPGSVYTNALAFLLFGKSILASRLLTFIWSILSILLLYNFYKILKIPLIPSMLLLFAYASWGPGHINFVWPVMFCLPLGLLTYFLVYLSTKAKTDKARNILIFLSGVTSGVVFIYKQNFGLAIIINSIVAILFFKKLRTYYTVLFYSLGYVGILFIQGLYLATTDSLEIYIREMYLFMFTKILGQGMLSSSYPWQYEGPPLYLLLKTLLYLSPFLISIIILFLKLRIHKLRQYFFFTTFCILFYLLSIRPTTDYIHLTPLFASLTVIIPFLYLANNYLPFSKRQKSIAYISLNAILIFFAISGFYSSIFKNYYRWNTPLYKNSSFLSIDKTNIWVDYENKKKITAITKYIKESTQKKDPIFIYGLSPMYYFLSERKNPTRYDYVHEAVQVEESVNDIIQTLKTRNIPLIASPTKLTDSNSKIEAYIISNYHLVHQISDFYFYSPNSDQNDKQKLK